MVIGLGTITAINIVWLQTAPIAFRTIGYKFYMVFFIPGFVATAWLWFYFPNTLGLPLEEVGRIFGDTDEVAGGTSSRVMADKSDIDAKDVGSSEDRAVSHVENKV